MSQMIKLISKVEDPELRAKLERELDRHEPIAGPGHLNLETHPDILRDGEALRLRVWHVPNPPRDPHWVGVDSPSEALAVIGALGRYDLYLDDVFASDRVISNAQGLEYWDVEFGEWVEWMNINGDSISEVLVEP